MLIELIDAKEAEKLRKAVRCNKVPKFKPEKQAPIMKHPKFTFKIDKGIPMPVLSLHAVYRLDQMKVGDSFKFPKTLQTTVSALTSKWRIKFKKQQFKIRRVDKKSCRCWRVK